MRTGSSNAAERAYHAAGGGGGNRTPVSARTPRRDPGSSNAVIHASGGHLRERALQDPGLKDYVCCWTLMITSFPRPLVLPLSPPPPTWDIPTVEAG
jgi:hypothetical protein